MLGNRKSMELAGRGLIMDAKWLIVISGFLEMQTPLYLVYRGFMLALLVYMLFMQILSCVFKPEKMVVLEALHYIVATMCAIVSLLTRIIVHSTFSEIRMELTKGIFLYEDEEEDEDLRKLKETIATQIRSKSRVFVALFVNGLCYNAIIFPLVEGFVLEKKIFEGDDVLNPYLVHIFYQPFSTKAGLGYFFGLLLEFAFFSCLYGIIVGGNWLYINCTVQLKVHLQLLNLSLRKIYKRAQSIYLQQASETKAPFPGSLNGNNDFQRCLYNCLRSNVKHHQALQRFMKISKPFCGMYLLNLLSNAAILFGIQLHLMNQIPPLNTLIGLMAAFVGEQLTVFFLCDLGEDITTEGKRLFFRLYSIRWYKCNRRFDQALHIMMSNCLKPMQLKALVFGVPASLEVYGDIVSAMYKISNLVRQSDSA